MQGRRRPLSGHREISADLLSKVGGWESSASLHWTLARCGGTNHPHLKQLKILKYKDLWAKKGQSLPLRHLSLKALVFLVWKQVISKRPAPDEIGDVNKCTVTAIRLRGMRSRQLGRLQVYVRSPFDLERSTNCFDQRSALIKQSKDIRMGI